MENVDGEQEECDTAKRSRRRRCGDLAALALALTLLAPGIASAGDSEGERATLKGLSGVLVLVAVGSSGAEPAGLSRTEFQTDVELKLRIAGIKLLTKEDLLAAPGQPVLALVVVHDSERGKDTFAIDLNVSQQIALLRDPRIVAYIPTWSSPTLEYADLSSTRAGAKDLMDAFVNAWLSVNPKE